MLLFVDLIKVYFGLVRNIKFEYAKYAVGVNIEIYH